MQKETDKVGVFVNSLLCVMFTVVIAMFALSQHNRISANHDKSYERYLDYKFIIRQGSKSTAIVVTMKDFHRLRPVHLSNLKIMPLAENFVVLRGDGRLIELAFFRLHNLDIMKHKKNDLRPER